METIAKKVSWFKPLINFAMGSNLDVRFGSEYVTEVIFYHTKS